MMRKVRRQFYATTFIACGSKCVSKAGAVVLTLHDWLHITGIDPYLNALRV